MVELKTNKEYEWFLESLSIVNRQGGSRLHLVWSGVDVEYKVHEWPLIGEDGKPGIRIVELMQRLNGGEFNNGNTPQPADFLKRGTHLFAKVHRHWTESRTDDIVYEFIYDTISSGGLKKTVEIPESVKKRVLFRANQSKTREEAAERLRPEGTEYVKALDHMLKTGEVKFP